MALPILQAMAQSVKPPRRIIFVLTPGGFIMNRWKCPIAGTEARSFPLSPILSELAAIRQHCTFIEGVPMTSSMDARTCASGHPEGATAVFTGAFAGPGSFGGGMDPCTVGPPLTESVDSRLARAVGGATRFPSLHVGALVHKPFPGRRCFYGPNQTIITPQQDPALVFKSVFGDFSTAPVTATPTLEDERFILDAVAGDFKALRCKLGGEDRMRLDRHAAEIESLATRLGLSSSGQACSKPAAPPALNATTFSQMPAIIRTQMDLVAMALACDLTRVVGIQIHAPDMDGQPPYTWLGHDLAWHMITHLEGTDPENRYEQTNRWQAKQVLYLAQKLASLQEADGTSVLDNSVIVWASEVGTGWNHDKKDVAFTLIGKGQGYFDTGKYVKFAGDSSTRHNRLLVHFLRYFGLADPGFGHPDYHGPPLPSIAA